MSTRWEHWDLEKWAEFKGCPNITEEIIEDFLKSTWDRDIFKPVRGWHHVHPNSFVLEMLESCTIEMLKKHIQDLFGPKYRKRILTVLEGTGRTRCIVEVYKELWETEEDRMLLEEELAVMMWFISRDLKDKDRIVLELEPVQSQNCTDWVYEKCDGKIFHICRKTDFDKIMKLGLRTKGSFDIDRKGRQYVGYGRRIRYRNFPNRTYFFCGETNDEVQRTFKEIVHDKFLNPKGKYKVLMVDLKKCDIGFATFFKDTMYDENGAIYSHLYIPPKFLTDVTDDFSL